MTLQTAWDAALEAWRGDALETQATRQTRYSQLWAFYLNDPYDEGVNEIAQGYKSDRGLYTSIKPLYNPVTRLVDFYVAKVAGGTIDPTGETGALPLTDAAPETIAAILQVWNWSKWSTYKNLWVRYGAALGDSIIKIVEDQAARQVSLQVHWPGDLIDADFDRLGNITYAEFEYVAQERAADGDVDTYTYREVITPGSFATYKDEVPYDYVNETSRGEYAEWENEFGFVPVVLTCHKDGPSNWGLCAFHHGLPKIDDLNDLASHLGDQIRKAIHPQWISYGTRSGSGLERSDKMWHHPNENGKVEALVEDIDISAVTKEIGQRLRELEQDFPELKVYQMATTQELSGRAVNLLLGDVIDRVVEARGQYDHSLVLANQMALSIGGFRGYWSKDLPLDHAIGERDIFPADESEQMDLEIKRLTVQAQQAALTQPFGG